MKQTTIHRILLYTVITAALIFVFGLAQFPAQASQPAAGMFQVTEMPGVDQTAIVPETGGTAYGGASGSWILWVVLGIAVIALIAAIASGRATRTDI